MAGIGAMNVLGGGPAGLYVGILMKLADPACRVRVYERNRPDDTFGWGVVFSDQTVQNLAKADPRSAALIADNFAHWDDIEVRIRSEVIRSGGHGFIGIARKRLLEILQARAAELAVELAFEAEISDLNQLMDADLVVAADGVNSLARNSDPDHFGALVETRTNRYVWYGTHQTFDAFLFAFEETEHGWIWAHAYKFDADTSTFIVECAPETFEKFGFGRMSQEESIATCERLFSDHLGGHRLMSNARHLRGSAWLNFQRIACGRWFKDKLVLMGDAAHTAHFSIGSGTKLALEDAIELVAALGEEPTLTGALERYQAVRDLDYLKLQNAARNSTEWFEHLDRYLHFPPKQFAYSLLTRSQRVSHENLRLRDRDWLEGVERWFAGEEGKNGPPTPPMFTPYRLRGLELANRVVVSPMCMYSAKDGLPDDFHLVHYGSRAQGGTGLIYTEMTDVEPRGRITPGCTGIWNEAQAKAWARIVGYVHAQTGAKFCLQLGHAGVKASTKVPWEAAFDDEPLDGAEAWEVLGPTSDPWQPGNPVPRAMNRADMDEVIAAYLNSVELAKLAGFDMLELHAAHGYLLSSFLTPAMNRREDDYGGSLENRLRFPLEVFAAIRDAWPRERPISVRISATDWLDNGGLSGGDAVAIGRAFSEAGADLIDVSAGQTSKDGRPVYGRMFQTPFSDLIRNEGRVATMAVGNIFEPDHVNSILVSGRADLCCLARPHLADPYWAKHAAAQLGYEDMAWPVQYRAGRDQLYRNTARAAAGGAG
jgi:anthraniloyl-CoA monooxygenase